MLLAAVFFTRHFIFIRLSGSFSNKYFIHLIIFGILARNKIVFCHASTCIYPVLHFTYCFSQGALDKMIVLINASLVFFHSVCPRLFNGLFVTCLEVT